METKNPTENIDTLGAKEDNRRKRINKYKKVIIYTLISLLIVNIVLWAVIILKVNSIEDRLANFNLAIIYNKWRIYG